MSEPRLISHLRRHPLTHDQALRLRVLVTFPDRQFSLLPSDTRLLRLGLARTLQREVVQVSDLGLSVGLAPDGRFRLAERHPFFRACPACQGAGVANEEELLSRRGFRVRRCPACGGSGYVPAPAKYPELT